MKDFFDRTLIISPHCDDETIGCGGLLTRIAKNNQQALIVVVAKSSGYSAFIDKHITNEDRLSELKASIKVMAQGNEDAIKLVQLSSPDYEFTDGSLDLISKKVYVSLLDRIVEDFKPTAVLFPYPSHHQDHKLVYEVTVSALRPSVDTNYIAFKAMYEYPYYDGWNPEKLTNKFYVELNQEELNTKLKALDCFKSQLRRDPRDLLDISAIKDLACSRGREIATYYAETYYPLSIVYKE